MISTWLIAKTFKKKQSWTFLQSTKYIKIIDKISLQHGYYIFGSSFEYKIL